MVSSERLPAPQSSMYGGEMSRFTDESGHLHELRAVVVVALSMAEVSLSQNPRDLPVAEWLFDPVEIEREQVGLRGILAAITALENGLLLENARNLRP